MSTLYVTEQGARIEKEYGRFLVTKDDEVLMEVPAARLAGVVLVGNVGVTTPALVALLDQGIALTLLDSLGRLRGRLLPATVKNMPLRHLQYERAQDPSFCLRVSRAIVLGKLRNYRYLAGRMLRTGAVPHGADEAMRRLAESIRRAKQAQGGNGLNALRSIETTSICNSLMEPPLCGNGLKALRSIETRRAMSPSATNMMGIRGNGLKALRRGLEES